MDESKSMDWQSFTQWAMGIVIILLIGWNGLIMTKFATFAETIAQLRTTVAVLSEKVDAYNRDSGKTNNVVEQMAKDIQEIKIMLAEKKK